MNQLHSRVRTNPSWDATFSRPLLGDAEGRVAQALHARCPSLGNKSLFLSYPFPILTILLLSLLSNHLHISFVITSSTLFFSFFFFPFLCTRYIQISMCNQSHAPSVPIHPDKKTSGMKSGSVSLDRKRLF